jgi:hypothetical protein
MFVSVALALGLQTASPAAGVYQPVGQERVAIIEAFEDVYGLSPVVGVVREYRASGSGGLAFLELRESGGGWALLERTQGQWHLVNGVAAAGTASCHDLWLQHVAALLRFEIARRERRRPDGDELFTLSFYGSLRRAWQEGTSSAQCSGSAFQ